MIYSKHTKRKFSIVFGSFAIVAVNKQNTREMKSSDFDGNK